MRGFSFLRRLFKWLTLGVAALVVLVLAATAVAYATYAMWRADRLTELATESRVVDTATGQIEYVLKGESGPVMLFLHGTPGGYDSAPAAGSHYRVLAPSRPGYLRTPIEVGRTPVEQARSYAALLDALGIQEPVLVMAASGGGPSGIEFAALYPERTAGLLAIETVSQTMGSEGGRSPLMQSDFAIWAAFGGLQKLQGDAGLVAMVIPDPDDRQRILDDPEKLDIFVRLIWSVWPVSLRDSGWQNDVLQFGRLELPAEDIRVPTLVVHGTADANVPFEQSEWLAEHVPGAQLHVVEGGDHMMPLTRKEEVDDAVDDFLRANALAEFVD